MIGKQDSLRKIVIHRAGSYDQLKLESFCLPVLSPQEVQIQVVAAGVNYADCCVRMGVYKSAKQYVGWPITPGFEVSGVIVAVGKEVDQLKVGDEVFAVTRFGGYASHICLPQEQVFRKPSSWSFEQIACFPTVFLTAYVAMITLGNAQKGSKVLVHSAAGGVGSAALQLGRILQALCVGVVGNGDKIQVAKEQGAIFVVDKSSEDWKKQSFSPEGFDVILDANGVSTLKDSYELLAPMGRLIVYGFASMLPKQGGKPNYLKLLWDYIRTPRFNPLSMTSENRSVCAFNLSFLFEKKEWLQEIMTILLAWIEEEKLQPLPVTSYSIEDVFQAHQDLESGKTTGKLVLLFSTQKGRT